MATVGTVIDRTFREYLSLADDQPVQAPLASAMDDTTTAVSMSAAVLDPSEADVYVEGSLVEVGLELMLITAVSTSDFPTTLDLTVIRGVSGTTAASHSVGDLAVAAPAFPRSSVFDAVADSVESLYPSVYRVVSEEITTTSGYVEVDAATVDPLHFTYTSGSQLCRSDAVLYTDLAAAVAASGKAVKVSAPSGKTGQLVSRALFARPTSESDDLSTLGVEASWERVVVVGAAAQVLAGRELDHVTQEYVTEQVRGQGYPVESASRQRNELLRFWQVLLGQASSRQQAQRDTLVTLAMPRFGGL